MNDIDFNKRLLQLMTENESTIQDCIRTTLKKEGGAAGLGAIEDACKKAGFEDDCKDAISKMKDVKQHSKGDYILDESVKNCGCGEEVCITYGKVEEAVEEVEESCCDAPEEMMEPEVEGSVEFKQHKNTDTGSVTIEASADNMQELAKVLKLAGLTLPKDMNPEQDPIQPEEMPVVDVQDGDAPTMDFPKTDVNPNMSTDKAVLTSVIRDKLRDYLKNSRS